MKDPIEVFRELDISPRFQEGLWEPQDQALRLYASKSQKFRVGAIELPTGAGKTIIGLLIAEAYRQDQLSVAYLCDTNALAERIMRDANDLGIPAVFVKGKGATADPGQREKDLDDYHYADAVGVFSFAGLLRGSGVSPPDILVVDDAHAFEAQILDSFSLTVGRDAYPELYKELLSLLSKEPHQGHIAEVFGVSGVVDQDYVELVPFTVVERLAPKIQDRLNAAAQAGGDLRWKLALFQGRLSEYLVIVSRDAIAFRPYLASVWDLKVGYEGDQTLGECLQRLVLMSATLGSVETIKERFGVSEEILLIDRTVVETQRETMGERLVIPLVSTGATSVISDETTELIAELVAEHGKVLILSNSFKDTKDIKGVLLSNGIDAKEYGSETDIDAFRKQDAGALLSTSRFIGLDLTSKACPVAVQVRIPYVMDPLDGLKKRIVRDAAYVDEKVVQRMTQALGRLNRGPNDRAVYFVLDERFPADMRKPDFFNHFPPELRAQILFGWREGGDDKTYAGKRKLAAAFLSGRISKEYVAGIGKFKRITVKDERPRQRFKAQYVDRLVSAWRLMTQGKLVDAAPIFEEIAKGRERDEPVMAAWSYYLAAHAHYVGHRHQGSPLNAKAVTGWLRNAYERGRTGWFSKLPGVIAYIEGGKAEGPAVSPPEALEVKQRIAENWREFRDSQQDEKGKPGSGPRTRWDRLCSAIRDGSHGEILHEAEAFFRLAGYDRVVRERAEAENVDLLAYSAIESPRHVLVIEVKTRKDANSKSQVISKEIDQVVGDAKAQEREGDLYEKVHPVILTNRERVHSEAIENSRKTRVRIVTANVFGDFLDRYFAAMERFWQFVDAGQEEAAIPTLPSPSALLPLFEFRSTPEASPSDVDAVFGGA